MISSRAAPESVIYISPEKEVNAGLWTLFVGASVFLGLRLYCKFTRRTGLWYDDYILVTSWLVLMANNIIISCEFATGYVTQGDWDDRMHILINISSCGTLIGQAWTKTAFAVTLLRMSNRNQKIILWICIVAMNGYMFFKVLFQWAKYCGRSDYQQWYRLQGFCINYNWEQDFKEGGNVLNIIMDFIFALFPWWITWPLEMRKMEKIGLCVTMSLGMIVAIVAAIRTGWKDNAPLHKHDSSYMWRNGMSMIWYSSEVAGTIIVQCIPILRPFLRDIHTSLTSRRLAGTDDARSNSATWRSTVDAKRASGTGYTSDGKRISAYNNHNPSNGIFAGNKKQGTTTEIIALKDIPEETREADVDTEREIMGWKKGFSSSSSSSEDLETDTRSMVGSGARSDAGTDIEHKMPTMPAGPLPLFSGDNWRFSEASTDVHSPSNAGAPHRGSGAGGGWMDFMESDRVERAKGTDEEKGLGLSPMPRRTGDRNSGGSGKG